MNAREPQYLKLRRSDDAVDAKEPFRDDLLSRSALAERLLQFLRRVEGPFTMAVTGAYGSGKTHFLRRCQPLFEAESIPTVLINIWESDFSSEPLAPILSELSRKFSDKIDGGDKRWHKAKSLAGKVAAAAGPTALKIAIEAVPGAGAIADAVEKLAEKRFAHYEEAKKSVHGLVRELTRLTNEIRHGGRKADADPTSADSNTPPVVVFIDELDRCRPNYAIDVLEVLKHFFHIPGIIFVLAIDREQLASAARAVFGVGLNADGYLRRFIDLECSLPKPDLRTFAFNVAQDKSSILRWDHFDVLIFPIAKLCENAGFTLRQTHQFLLRCSIAVKAASTVTASYDDVILLVFLREYDRSLFDAFVGARISAWDVFTKLRGIDPEFGNPSDRGSPYFVGLLAGVGEKEPPKPFVERLLEDYESKGIRCNADYLRNTLGGGTRMQMLRLVDAVNFCATFVG